MKYPEISYPVEAHSLTRKIEDDSYWYQHRNEIIFQIIKTYVNGHPLIYDLGGGNGVVTKALSEKGYPCVLVEALPDAIAIARERKIKTTIQQTIQEFNENDLSVVLLLDVVEHINQEEEILQKIFRQLKKDGTLIITVPAFNHLYTDIDHEIGHFRRYSCSKLSATLLKNGFKVSYAGYFFSLLYFLLLFFRVLPFLLKLKSGAKNRRENEHLKDHPKLNFLIKKILKFECIFIRHKLKIPFGTSCLIVATKQ